MSTSFLQAMAHLEDEAFTYFGASSKPCPLCWFYAPPERWGTGASVVVLQDLDTRVWTLTHGEVPVCGWLDKWLGDELDVNAFREGFALALAQAHWH